MTNFIGNETSLRAWMKETIAQILGVSSGSIELETRFRDMGLRSVHITVLVAQLSERIERKVLPTSAWQHPTPAALARYAAALAGEKPSKPDITDNRRPGGSLSEPIAVVGIGCRLPGGVNSPRELWAMLCEGGNGIREVPEERWNAESYLHDDPGHPGTMTTRWGGFIDDVDRFDAAFFGISPREAQQMDPQQRLTLEAAWSALEDAGIDIEHLRGAAVGVFMGSMWSDYARLTHGHPEMIDAHTATGQDTSIISARVSYFLGLQGGSVTVNTACSSSAVAIHLACQSLRTGESRMALAGGVHLMTSPQSTVAMTKFGAMNPAGECRAFDASANGYVRGEGVGIVVLKPLSRAIADGDRIYSIIRGSAINNDGFSNGLTAPNPEAQEAVLRNALSSAGLSPNQIHYVETHGPGTILGDPLEAGSIGAVYGPSRPVEHPLRIGSIKTNIGHTEAAAGVAGFMKTALCLYHRMLPPNLHFKQPNPYIDFDNLRIKVQTKLENWPSAEDLPRAGVSSFGFGGTNCHIVMEAAPENGTMLLPFSANDARTLRRKLTDATGLFSRVKSRQEAAALCRELALREGGGSHRAALMVADANKVLEELSRRLRDSAIGQSRERPRLVFVCPGHGGQWLGMGRSLLISEPVFRAAIERCDGLIQKHCGWSLIEEILADPERSRLSQHDVIQVASFSFCIALGELWKSWGVEPDAIVGHSVGEVTACVLSGILSLEEGLRVVAVRSRLMREVASGGGILLVKAAEDDLAQILRMCPGLSVAGYNSPISNLLAGTNADIENAEVQFRDQGVEFHRIKVDVASHSPAVDAALEPLRRELQNLSPRVPRIAIRSTVREIWLQGPECGPDHWADNLRQPVRFRQAIEALGKEGPAVFLEIGPHPVLMESMEQTLKQPGVQSWVFASCWRESNERDTMLNSLAQLYELGFTANWRAVAGSDPVLPISAGIYEEVNEFFGPATGHKADPSPLPAWPILLSGRSETALRAQAQRLLDHLQKREDISLLDLSFSLAVTRTQFDHRAAIVAHDRDELLSSLDALAHGNPAPNTVLGDSRGSGKLAVLFTGQGSQRPEMGRALYVAFPVFRDALDAACADLERLLAGLDIQDIEHETDQDPDHRPSLREVLFAPENSPLAALLDQTAYTQPALFALEVALFRLLETWGMKPDLLLGHSIGELAAAHLAGVFSLEDACSLVAARARLMQALRRDGAMVTLQASETEVLPLLDQYKGRVSSPPSTPPPPPLSPEIRTLFSTSHATSRNSAARPPACASAMPSTLPTWTACSTPSSARQKTYPSIPHAFPSSPTSPAPAPPIWNSAAPITG